MGPYCDRAIARPSPCRRRLQALHQRFEAEGPWRLYRVLEEMRLEVPGMRVDALFAADPSLSNLGALRPMAGNRIHHAANVAAYERTSRIGRQGATRLAGFSCACLCRKFICRTYGPKNGCQPRPDRLACCVIQVRMAGAAARLNPAFNRGWKR
jgi:hypothetical protein